MVGAVRCGAGLLAMLVAGILTRLGWVAPGRPAEEAGLLALPLQQGLTALGAVRRGRRIGGDDLRAGLGWLPVRRQWGAWRTGGVTGLLFLLVHGAAGDWQRLLALAPVVVLLSLARELGGSVRVSLAVYVMNNGLAAAALIARQLARG